MTPLGINCMTFKLRVFGRFVLFIRSSGFLFLVASHDSPDNHASDALSILESLLHLFEG